MRPTALELLRGVRALLINDVLQEAAAPHLRTQVMLAIGMLDAVAVELDHAPAVIAEERARLQTIATEALPVVERLSGASELANELRTLSTAPGDTAWRPMSALTDESAEASGALGQLAAFCDENADDTEAEALGRRVDAELRARVERRLRWTGAQAG